MLYNLAYVRGLATIARSLVGKPLYRQAPSWVVSYPKSGRTWHRILIGAYICFKYNQDVQYALDMKALSKRLKIPLLRYSHNGANFIDPWDGNDPRVGDPQIWQNGRVVLLLRDVKDTLVSSYFHAKYRKKTFDGSIFAFVRNPSTGVEKILIAMNRWHLNLALTKMHLVQTYESLHENTPKKLKEVLEFTGFEDIDDDAIRKAVEFGGADNLREMEKANFFNSARLCSYDNANAAKVRSARIGNYANHLSAEDIAYIDAMEDRIGNPFKSSEPGR